MVDSSIEGKTFLWSFLFFKVLIMQIWLHIFNNHLVIFCLCFHYIFFRFFFWSLFFVFR